MLKIAPSILSADFSRLGEEITSISNADYLHFDVMDGVFVPNISIGIPVLESLRKITSMTLDVHLMITEPIRFVKRFCDAGSDIVVFHYEADTHENIMESIKIIKSAGKKVGISIKPKTSEKVLDPYIENLDLVLVMTVEPGFGGQSFMADQLPKISAIRKTIDKLNLLCELEVDGGINPETAKLCASAGADVLVAGSDIFGAKNRAGRIAELRG